MKLLKSTVSSSRRITTIFSVIFCLLFVLVSPAFAEGAWVGGWDTLADGNSLLSLPTDIAVDSNRTVYAVDLGYQMVLKREYSALSWTFLPDQPYNKPGISHWLVGVTVDSANNVYVLNGYGGTINWLWKFNGSTWSEVGSGTQFISPCSVAVDQAGNVYVADKTSNAEVGCNQIRKWASGSWSVIGNWTFGGFTKIVSITTDINNYLYAIEALEMSNTPYSRLVRAASGTTTWLPYTTVDTPVNMLRVPNDLAVDRFGNVYVTDHQTQELHVFAKNATMWAQIRKDGNLVFNDIFSVAVDNKGYVYVCDPNHDAGSPGRRILRHQPWATQLIWETQPTGKPALQILSPSPILSLAGPGGDLITGVNTNSAHVSLTVPAGATLGGTQFRTFNNGKATFSDLSVDKAGTYTLTGLSTIASTNIVNAVWAFPNVDLSRVSSSFTITSPLAAPPTANPASGATVPNNSIVTLSSTTAGAHFHYTTNGSTPTGSSPSGNQVTLTGANGSTVTVKAFTSATGFVDSDIATFTYTISWPKAVTPTANPSSGSIVPNNSAITLSTITPDSHFHYTTNGSTPTGSSPSGNQVTLTGANGSIVTVKAIASASNFIDSDIAVFTYTIEHRLFLPVITR